MFGDEHLRDEAIYIVRKLFSDKNIGLVLKDKDFVLNLPWLLDKMCDNVGLRNETIGVIRELLSFERTDIVLESKDLMLNLPSILRETLNFWGVRSEGKVVNVVKRLLFVKHIDTISKNNDLMEWLELRLRDIFDSKNLKIEALDIVKNLFSDENVVSRISEMSHIAGLPGLLEDMLKDINSRDEAIRIVRKIFLKKDINNLSKFLTFIVNFFEKFGKI